MSAKNLCTATYIARRAAGLAPYGSEEQVSSAIASANKKWTRDEVLRNCGDTEGSASTPSVIPFSEEVSTVTGSITGDSSSERSGLSSDGSSRHGRDKIVWDELRLGHRIQPYRHYAHCADDVRLLSRFLELARLPDVEGECVKLCLRAIKLLRLCDYSLEDIASTLAHASSYFLDAYGLCGSHMDASEIGNVLVTLMFVAHCYIQDETCPLRVWHQHLFRKYCPLKTLNSAVIRLLEIRKYILRIDDDELDERYVFLLAAASRVVVPCGGGAALTSTSCCGAPSTEPAGRQFGYD